MGKFTDRAIQLLSQGRHDELQKELAELEEKYRYSLKARTSLHEANQKLIADNTKLLVQVTQMQGDRKRILEQGEQVAYQLNAQMDRSQVQRQQELESLVQDNVRLKIRVRELEDAQRKAG